MLILFSSANPSAEHQTTKRIFMLDAKSPDFWNLIDSAAKLETVATGFGFTEGPMWDPARLRSVFVELRSSPFF
jgi:gluconolactonase